MVTAVKRVGVTFDDVIGLLPGDVLASFTSDGGVLCCVACFIILSESQGILKVSCRCQGHL